jgi:hypothetical protein
MIDPQLSVPEDPIFIFPAVTLPAGIDVTDVNPVIWDAGILQLTDPQVIAPVPALMLLLFVVIVPQVNVPDPALILLLFVVIVVEFNAPQVIPPDPALIALLFVTTPLQPNILQVTLPAAILPPFVFIEPHEIAPPPALILLLFVVIVVEVNVPQVIAPDPALIALLFVVIAPQLSVPEDPIFIFPAVTFPAGIDVTDVKPVIWDAGILQLTDPHVIAPVPALMLLLFVVILVEVNSPQVSFPELIDILPELIDILE